MSRWLAQIAAASALVAAMAGGAAFYLLRQNWMLAAQVAEMERFMRAAQAAEAASRAQAERERARAAALEAATPQIEDGPDVALPDDLVDVLRNLPAELQPPRGAPGNPVRADRPGAGSKP